MGKQVVVVGGGIIGASYAYHLALGGADVKLLDAMHNVGGVATPNSWAWINASWGNPEPYFKLRHHSMLLWRHLDKNIAGLDVDWCGGLLWDLPEQELRAFVKQQSAWGYGVKLVDGTAARLIEPQLSETPLLAAHVGEEGAVEPVHAVEKLMQAAQALGADVLKGVRAKRLVEDGGRMVGVMTDDGVLEADEVVLAAGVGCNDLLSPHGLVLDIEAPAGLLVHSEPAGEILNGLVMAPELHVRQTAEGRLVAGTDFGGADPGDDPDGAAAALFNRVQSFLKYGDQLKFSHATLGYRPTPKDGVSIVGRLGDVQGLYVVCTHSGVTLAPALGDLGAQELLNGQRHELLTPFSPDRLLNRS